MKNKWAIVTLIRGEKIEPLAKFTHNGDAYTYASKVATRMEEIVTDPGKITVKQTDGQTLHYRFDGKSINYQ